MLAALPSALIENKQADSYKLLQNKLHTEKASPKRFGQNVRSALDFRRGYPITVTICQMSEFRAEM